jgi:MFS family permease
MLDRRPRATPTAAAREPLFTANFLLACLSSVSAFGSFYLLLATLPEYVLQVGGNESDVGFIIGVFSLTAVLLRVWIGRAADQRGPRLFMIVGSAVLAISSALYVLTRSVSSLLLLRVLHGAGWAAFGTAASAFVADIVPPARRGEAMGYYGMFSNLAMAVGPAAGIGLAKAFGYDVVFWVAAGLAAAGPVLTAAIRAPSHPAPLAPAPASGPWGPRLRELVWRYVERTSLFPSLVFALVTVTYGSIVSFLPIYAHKRGLENAGTFFTVYAVVLAGSRSFTGKLSDHYGRAAVIVPGMLAAAAALAVLAQASGLADFMVVAVLYGLAFAALQPALLALIADRAPFGRRGAAMGTFATAIDLGIGGGSFVWGAVAQRAGYDVMYTSSAAVALLALLVFLIGVRSTRARATAL